MMVPEKEHSPHLKPGEKASPEEAHRYYEEIGRKGGQKGGQKVKRLIHEGEEKLAEEQEEKKH